MDTPSKYRGFLLYKCRRCGEVYGNLHSPDCMVSIICVETGSKQPFTGQPDPKITDIHFCKDGHMGVTDLIGAELDEPEPLED